MKKLVVSEKDMAAAVVAHLRDEGWEIYQEVENKKHGDIIDIVATQGPLLWAIEVKTTFNLKVLSQAARHRAHAHHVSVATPARSRRGDGYHEYAFAEQVLRAFGIGHIEIRPGPPHLVKEAVLPTMRRKITQHLQESLHEEQKTYAVAGSPTGRRWTPFKGTCNDLLSVVRATPGIPLADAIRQVKHHYRLETTARSCLTKRIMQGVVPGVELRHVEKKLCLFLKEQ